MILCVPVQFYLQLIFSFDASLDRGIHMCVYETLSRLLGQLSMTFVSRTAEESQYLYKLCEIRILYGSHGDLVPDADSRILAGSYSVFVLPRKNK